MDKKRILTGESRGNRGGTGLALFLCCLGCLLFKSATARADTASYAATDGASYTSAKLYSFCPTAPSVFASATHVWHLGEASGNSRADSVGSIALNETGGTVSSAAGVHGNAVDFNTADHYLTAASGFALTAPYSIELWVKFRSYPAPNCTLFLASDDGDGQAPFVLNEDGTVLFSESSGGGAAPLSSSLSLNAWHLLIGVVPATGTIKVSIDGGTLAAGDPTSYTAVGDATVIMGLAKPLVPDGLIDEPTVFSTALSQSDINTLWNSGAGNFAP